MDIQKKLQKIQDERNWSNYEFAKRAGLSETTVTNLFKRNNAPIFSALEALYSACDITFSQFFTEGNASIILTEEQKTLLIKWSALTEKQKNILIELMSNI